MNTIARPGSPKKSAATVFSALIAAALLSSCGNSAATQGNSANGEPKSGGDLVFQLDSLGDTWVPNNSSISSFQANVWGDLTDKLLYVDEKGEVSPWIAQSWEESPDAKQFTLHLKDGVTFSDGTPLDAEAVVANLNYWAKGIPEEGIPRVGQFPSANYIGATAVDPLTVSVSFSEPALSFIPTLGYHGSILLSPDSVKGSIEEQGDLSESIGSGPFVVEDWKSADFVKVVKREDYEWGPQARGHTGPAYLDSITFKQIPEASLRAGSLQSRQADVVYNLTPQELGGLKNAGFGVYTPTYLGFTQGYALKTNTEPFNDIAVRQAVQHGIDRQQIVDTVYTEDWTIAQSILQSNVPESTDHASSFTFNPAESRRLLEEAGWREGSDGIREKDGKKLSFTLYPNPYVATYAAVDELVAQQLRDIGFDVSIQVFDVPTYNNRVIDNPELQIQGVSNSVVDAGALASVITGANGNTDWFRTGESDETLNRLSSDIISSSDRDSRAATLDEAQAYVLDQAYFVPLTNIVQRIYVTSGDLHDVTFNGLAVASYATAWLDR